VRAMKSGLPGRGGEYHDGEDDGIEELEATRTLSGSDESHSKRARMVANDSNDGVSSHSYSPPNVCS